MTRLLIFALLLSAPYPLFQRAATLKPHFWAGSVGAFMIPHRESQPMTMAAGDFNGDGKLDLAVGSVWNNEYSNDLAIYPGKGGGDFLSPSVTQLNARPSKIVAADLNRDGISDLVLISRRQDDKLPARLLVFAGQKNAPPKETWSRDFPYPRQLEDLFIADFDGDGILDLGVSTIRSFLVFRGKGDGTFATAVAVCPGMVRLVADFNRDGRPDLLLQAPNSDFEVRLNQRSLGFSPPLASPPEEGRFLTSGDLNDDAIIDLVTGSLTQAFLWLGNGDGTFHSVGSEEVPAGSELRFARIMQARSPHQTDLWLVTWHRADGGILMFPGPVSETSAKPISLPTDFTPSDLIVADFNGDGRQDFAVSSMGKCTTSVYLQR